MAALLGEHRNLEYKHKLVIYNHEDCQALKLLLEFLSTIKEKDDSLLDIDCFVHSKKSRNNSVKNPLHYQEGFYGFGFLRW